MAETSFHRNAATFGSGIRRILELTEDEFHPPLSGREGTTQTADLNETRNDALDDYYDDLMDQRFVLTLEDDRVVGFLSFRQEYRTDVLEAYSPSNYVSTVAVHPDERRQGYARRMYRTLLNDIPESVRSPCITTRTWSTNQSHLALLAELGFENVATLRNDRGEGIHTVYYVRKRESR